MPRIHVLDKAVAELIAAGEVVERPASIVKELVENAVDAGATAVTVEIRGGGVQYIRIQDNGCGIEREDMPKAFVRHATSKVRSADDLAAIGTLGFRGEALASIAAMCRVELTSKTEAEEEGTTCRIEGGEMLDSFPAGCPTGTTITVRDVFFNTPARMKFLKKDISEGNSVAQVVDKCALSHPEVAFRFIRDGAQKLRTTGGGDLLAVIRAVYGREMADRMIPVDYHYENRIHVHGYLSAPAGQKPSRTYQNFFINGRYVRTRTASAALEEACKNKIMAGKFPACVLNLDIAADTVDVNVHPAKIEVRFVEEKPIFHAVYFGAKTALSALDAPLAPLPQPAGDREIAQPVSREIPDRPKPAAPVQERMNAREFQVLFSEEIKPAPAFSRPMTLHASKPSLDISVDDEPVFVKHPRPEPEAAAWEPLLKPGPIPEEAPEQQAVTRPPVEQARMEPEEYRLIGEAFGTYILMERGEELYFVDKHAAHERLLYETLKENLRYGNRQVLLSPQTVTLDREDCDALLSDLDRVEAMGFAIEDFGDGTVLVRETPIELGRQDVAGIVAEIADSIRAGKRDLTPDALDRLYYSIACRSAVKGGDHSQPEELEELVRRLRQNPEITHCPHGRPVVQRMGRKEIEKLFGRLG